MPYNRTTAKTLLTGKEYELFEDSTGERLTAMSEAGLRKTVTRARRTREKYVDLLRRQRLATRGRTGSKSGNTGVANARTAEKRDVLTEVLKRFELRLQRLEAEREREERRAAKEAARELLANKRSAEARQRAARSKTASPKARARAPTSGGSKTSGANSESARGAAHASQLHAARSRPIQAHLRSAGRRAQARRDTRGRSR